MLIQDITNTQTSCDLYYYYILSYAICVHVVFAHNSFIPPKQIMIRTSYVPFDDILCTIISTKEKRNLRNKKLIDFVLFGYNGRCDRILWKGEGLKQIWYLRGESKFSDHRPVYSLFSVQIDIANKYKPTSTTRTKFCTNRLSTNTALSTTCAAKVQAEELLLVSRARSCIHTASRF